MSIPLPDPAISPAAGANSARARSVSRWSPTAAAAWAIRHHSASRRRSRGGSGARRRAAGNHLQMPVTVVQQDWGSVLGYDAAGLWRAWAPDLVHDTLTAGHFMAEEAPGEIVDALRALVMR
ncbi:hypothetical protein ACFWAY_32715 [Rhodococcus sp. NPDC059968]|uniref:hypothetical protein n=1 Tax=Rhodococcus sp. NPDC059968 TaxID=3347017 RepID=UPI0036711257